MAVVETLTLGMLTLVGGPYRGGPTVSVRFANNGPRTEVLMTREEWHSLLALSDLQRSQALQLTRYRAALKEALEIAWRRGRNEFPPQDSDRLSALKDFLDGKVDHL